MTNYERIKNMSVEEMAEFLKTCVSDDLTHGIGCYQCIDYGTHHYTEGDCEANCSIFSIGLDVKKYLESEVTND